MSLPLLELYVFVLAAFVGFLVITRVPPLLHTPLMSATNAISAISLVGSLVAAGNNKGDVSTILGFAAVTAATINVVGGFIITDRMLKMFKRKDTAGLGARRSALGAPPPPDSSPGAPGSAPVAERQAPRPQ